ncbi:MAG: hypothetical protein U0441_00605 [Polyangiaceae bacterium]
MRRFLCTAFAAVIASSLVGCAGETDTDDLAGNAPVVEPQTGGSIYGSGGSNGLAFQALDEWQGYLIRAARKPLVAPGTNQIANDDAIILMGNPMGYSLMSYAAACGVPAKMEIQSGAQSVVGMGHLKISKKWIEEGLLKSEIEELLGCVAAHVNHYHGVKLDFTGLNVIDDGDPHTEFWVEEARWGATIVDNDKAIFTAWLNPHFEPPGCVLYPDPWEAFAQRFCGQHLSACNLKQGNEKACHMEDTGKWVCDDKPVIETWLTESELPVAYCPPP